MKVLKFAWVFAVLVSLQQAFAESTVVPKYAVTGDAEIRVESGEVRRIEYLSGTTAATITKTGGGTLEIGVLGSENFTFIVQEGSLRSVRPGKLALAKEQATFHADATETSSMTFKTAGSPSVTQWNDADGREMFAHLRFSTSTAPTLKTGVCNGLDVVDFGGFVGGGNSGAGACFMQLSSTNIMRESFWVWRDQPGTKDLQKADGADFRGPTPVSLSSACYRGTGGNGHPFIFSAVGPPSSMNPIATIDGKTIPMTTSRVDEGWHIATVRLSGTTSTFDANTYGAEAFGRKSLNSEYGGFQLAEVVLCEDSLPDADYAYVSAYLNSKWFRAKTPLICVSEGAVLDVSEISWDINRLQVVDESNVIGQEKLCVREYSSPNDAGFTVSDGVYAAADQAVTATPNLRFEGEAEISVAAGTARGNVVDAAGTLTKSGAGALELAYLTEGVSGLAVTAGSLTLSPLLSAASALHFDASESVTTETADGDALVTNWGDVNAHRGSALVPVTDGYKFKTSVTVHKPKLVTNAANGLPLVDFGAFTDYYHSDTDKSDEWGGGLKATHALGGGKNAVATCNGWRQCFVVWADHDEAADLPLVEGSEFVGPCLFGENYSWTRGKGGDGNGFPIAGTDSADFRQSLFLDGVKIAYADCKTYRVPSGLHLFDSQPGTVDGLSGVSYAGYYVNTKENSRYGGVMFGEMMFFRHVLSAGQRQKTAAALGVKWFGTDKWKLEQVFGSLSVADGASASFPYADVTVTNLTASGSVSARSLTVAAGGKLIVDATDRVLTADGVSFAGKGTIVLNADVGSTIAEPIKVIAATDGPATAQKVPGWRTKTGVKAVLVRRADGYYLDPAPGLMLILR